MKNFLEKNKVFTLIIAGALLISILAVGAQREANAREASANIFDNIWKKITGNVSTSSIVTGALPDVPLYKPAIDYERAVVAAVKKASPAVVSITVSKNVPIIENCATNPFGNILPEFRQFFGDVPEFSEPCDTGKTRLKEIGGGSGFIVSENGLIVTNKHVVLDTKASYTVFTNDGKKYDAKVLARDPVQDLAILQIEARDLPSVELGDSSSIELGQTAIAIGNALGEFRNTVSVGVISGLSRTVTAFGAGIEETISGVIQTDTAINLGNSGGPLLNLKGEVIGINTAVAADAANIGFAIPINRAKRDIQTVKQGGEIEVPYLGVRYLIITKDVAETQKLSVDYGVLLERSEDGPAVMPSSPAARAGLKAGDIILEVNGKKLDKDNSLSNIINEANVGDTITLIVRRGDETLTINVVLEKRPE